MKKNFIIIALFLLPSIASAHSVELDSDGCHHDLRYGGYHCHRGELAGRRFRSMNQAAAALGGGLTEYRMVLKVIDGDTLLLDSQEKVRLIGVKTPGAADSSVSHHCYASEAHNFMRLMVEGKKVRLEYGVDRRNRAGVTMAYVYLDDDTFLNAEIVRQGYGYASLDDPLDYIDNLFRQSEEEAKARRRGLWNNCNNRNLLRECVYFVTSRNYSEIALSADVSPDWYEMPLSSIAAESADLKGFYYDKANIRQTTHDGLTFWVKESISSEATGFHSPRGVDLTGLQLSYLNLLEFDCEANSRRMIQHCLTGRSPEGDSVIINADLIPGEEMWRPVEETALFNRICGRD